MLLHAIAETSRQVSAVSARGAKRDLIAQALRDAGDQVELAVAYLIAQPRQRRTGVGWRSLPDRPAPAATPTLTLADVDGAFQALATATGSGAQARRQQILTDLYEQASATEQDFLTALITGELRQGALAGVVEDAIARAFDLPIATVRRAAMLSGSLPATARIAHADGPAGLDAVRLTVGTAVAPMLAGSAPTVAEGLAAARNDPDDPLVVDAKVDGIRVQIHRTGDEVRVFTRSLDDITPRLPEIVAVVRELACERAIIDGEVVAVDVDGRPRAFQVTGARTASHGADSTVRLALMCFDLLHRDGADLIDEPATVRFAHLAELAGALVVPRASIDDAAAAQTFFDTVVGQGFEGVVVKNLTTAYSAGRRGQGWVKVKPVSTLDLVVLGVEWGSGRRTGTLSNIHLGARDPQTGEFVMVGKTFKGMTDAMLAWQTRRFLELERDRDGHVVWVYPEQVVEIAYDGVQRSRRYPGGVALRFARVLRYRDDKSPSQADSLATLTAQIDGDAPATQ